MRPTPPWRGGQRKHAHEPGAHDLTHDAQSVLATSGAGGDSFVVVQPAHTPGPLPGSGAATPATLSRFAATPPVPGAAPTAAGTDVLGLDGHPLSALRHAVDAACADAQPRDQDQDENRRRRPDDAPAGKKALLPFSPLPAPRAFASWRQEEGEDDDGDDDVARCQGVQPRRLAGGGGRRADAGSCGGQLGASGDEEEEGAEQEEQEGSCSQSLSCAATPDEGAGGEFAGAKARGGGKGPMYRQWVSGGARDDDELVSLVRDMEMSTINDPALAPVAPAAVAAAGMAGGQRGGNMVVSPAPFHVQQRAWRQLHSGEAPATPPSPAELVRPC